MKNTENGSLTRDDLTSAIESDFGVDINDVLRNEAQKNNDYNKADIDEFNRELAGDFDPISSLVKNASESSHIESFEADKINQENQASNTPLFDVNSAQKKTPLKSKSAMKMQYEAESNAIKKRIGSIQSIRKNLGLNQRKASQLLLVDPSAWNRWERAGNDAPFYIYKALEWYSLLVDKHPNMGNSFWLQQDNIKLNEELLGQIKKEIKSEIAMERSELADVKRASLILKLSMLGVFLVGITLGLFI